MSRGLPDTAGAAALEGTGLHALLEECLNTGSMASDFDSYSFEADGKKQEIDLLTDEQQDAVQQILDYVRSFKGNKFYEMQVTYGRAIGQPDDLAWGTSDISILDGTHLHVMDAKFGRRFVSQVENKQMLLYAIGVVDALEALGDEVETISLHILQPRVTAKLGNQPWTITRDELDEFIVQFQEAAARVAQADETFAPAKEAWQNEFLIEGESQCMYCRAAAACPKLETLAADASREVTLSANDIGDFEIVSQLEALPPAQLALNFERLPLLEIFAKAVSAEVYRRAGEGTNLPGYKLIKGREGNRKWADEEAVRKAAEELGVTPAGMNAEPKLKTPAQLEKVFAIVLEDKAAAKEAISRLTVRSPAKPTVVREDQPGELWTGGSVEDEFGLV